MHTNIRTERHTVTAVLAGACALGALSAAVPLVATVLLAALIGAGAAVVGFAIHAWRTTRIPNQVTTDNPSPRHLERV
jgi:hypothetical protein